MKLVEYKAIGCNGNGEWAEFYKKLDEDNYDSDLEFRDEIEKEGFNVVALYRIDDVVLIKKEV